MCTAEQESEPRGGLYDKWGGGGVWVLNTSQGEETLFRKLRNALTMDERCEVINGSGGVFCEDAQVCAEMARLLKP